MSPFGRELLDHTTDEPDLRSYAGPVDAATAAAPDVVLWDDDAAITRFARWAVLVSLVGRLAAGRARQRAPDLLARGDV